LISLLTFLGPLVRGLQRYMWRLRGMVEIEQEMPDAPREAPNVDLVDRSYELRYWSEQGHEKEQLLGGVMEFLIPRKYLITVDPGWNRWDLEVYRGIWSKARLAVAVENHGGDKRLHHVRCEVRLTQVARLSLGGFAIAVACGLLFGVPEITAVGGALGLVNLAVVVAENVRLGRIMNDTFDIVAANIGLRPVNGSGNPSEPKKAA
jgi:hypothetical protein